MGNILRIGHRGAMGYCRGNTLPCFEKAIKLGADMVELDVHLRKNKLLVFHATKELSRFVPTLNQVIDLVDRRAKIDIELKGKNTGVPTALLIDEYLEKGWDEDDFMISSFKVKELEDFKSFGLDVKMSLLVKNRRKNIVEIAEELNVFSVNLAHKVATKQLIDRLHDRDFKVFVWTVNKEKDIRKLISLKVDGIISNYPDRLNL